MIPNFTEYQKQPGTHLSISEHHHTCTFLDAVLISMATALQTEASDSALLVAVDWARE